MVAIETNDIAEEQKLQQNALNANGEEKKLEEKLQNENTKLELPDGRLVSELRELIRDEYEQRPTAYSAAYYQQLMDERSPFTCWRFLLQANKQVEAALELVKSTLAWRLQNRLDELTNEQFIKEFWFYSPCMFAGTSKRDQDVFYVIGRLYRKPDAAFRQTVRDFCAKLIFGWDEQHKDDLRQLCLVFDVSDTGLRNMDLDFMTWMVTILDHLPTRIAVVYVVGIPFIVRPLIRLVISWLPEKFSRLVHCGTYEQLVLANIEPESLPEPVGGSFAEHHYRRAPVETPWAADSEPYADERMQKAIEESIGFSVSEEKRDYYRHMQIEHERTLQQQQQQQLNAAQLVNAK